TRRRELQCAELADRDNGLHRTLAERTAAKQRRALVILQGAGHDFRSGSRAAVDEHDQRLAVGEIARRRVAALGVVRIAAGSGNSFAALKERIGDRYGLIELTAAVVAKINDVALQLVGRNLLLALGDAFLELSLRALALEA